MSETTQPVMDERALLTFTALDGSADVGELIGVIQQLALVRSLPDIQRIVRRAARRLTRADGATFVLRDHGFCVYADEDAIAPLWKGMRFPMDGCVSGWAMLNRQPAVVADIYEDERVPHDAYRRTFVRSMATVPIRQLDPLGAIGVYWAEPHRATRHEVQLLQALADSTAVAMENVRVYSKLEEAHAEMLRRLALAAEYRDQATFRHTARVAHVSALVAEQLGMDERFVSTIRQAAPLHDIGKLAVADSILLKPERLTSDELSQMRSHAASGAAILAGSHSELLQMAEEIALTHHEWWDGSGYPAGRSGDGIPMSGRIVALADVFDALTHARPYKLAWSISDALEEIDELTGRQFDPMVATAFQALGEGALQLDDAEMADMTA